ncbi:pseudaminic acid cytidylyltransferase [Shewanella sp. WXL01]|uniref:pseudaminic acid cytidylyltransferase n=1 Tax=Shewanella sp. WXL01 TaxID=2709721 RepID=UPI00143825C2|nr:pseudaminic acid cytidylyltransferase [Shewanella sp. WXL01]NKF51055.1 pseudaminic acid cytidylyltransferase [Shewanella sp. WXL01]
MKVAIIPARGGSKRIVGKNIKLFNGKPIIAYSIEAALESNCFDKVIVSTDCQKIANVAEQYGAEVPFVRPAQLSDDHATTAVVITHAINWLREHQYNPEFVCVLYATAPFVQGETLRQSLEQLLLQQKKNYCFAVTEFPSPIQRAFKVTDDNGVQMFQPQHFNSRSQDLEKAYHDAGQFYWGKASAFVDPKSKGMFSSEAMPFVLPNHQVQDIDTLDDWRRAEALHKLMLAETAVMTEKSHG